MVERTGNAPTRQVGKVLAFVGVMFLVVGLFGGSAGAAGKNGNEGGGKSGAFGQLKKAAEELDAPAADSANEDCGEYCSTSDSTTPSENGNGGGNGNQPCAGCVGNADNKNPPGQFKDGGDPNNGYECDGNKGVAKGNPAHSVCNPLTTAPPQTTTTVAQTTTTAAPEPTTTAAVGGVNTTRPEVQGVQFSRGTETARGLAATGAGFMRPFTLVGALLLLLGVALMILRVNPSTARV